MDTSNLTLVYNIFHDTYTVLLILTEMVLTIRDVTQKKLFSVAHRGQYVGITIDPKRRRGQHERNGYNRIMYCARTQNMELAENKLLEACPGDENIQLYSNASPDPGYVYIIV